MSSFTESYNKIGLKAVKYSMPVVLELFP